MLKRCWTWLTTAKAQIISYPAMDELRDQVLVLSSRVHHLEIENRDMKARLTGTENDLAWLMKPEESSTMSGQCDTSVTVSRL